MNELNSKQLFDMAKQAKKEKNYDLEYNYLIQGVSLVPTNTKIINALIRNLRKTGKILELKMWLGELYRLKPNGKILYELINLEQSSGNYKRARMLLLENKRFDPNNKRLDKRIEKNNVKEMNSIIANSLFVLNEEEVELVKRARNIIYSEDDFTNKYNNILNIISCLSDEIIFSIMAELYKNGAREYLIVNYIKKYRKKLEVEKDLKGLKLLNIILELVMSKKTRRFNWNNFWVKNTSILCNGINTSKTLVKNALEIWQS